MKPPETQYTEVADARIGHQTVGDGPIDLVFVHGMASNIETAGPSEVLVSSTVKDLVVGSGLNFDGRGSHELKGVPGEWRLYRVAG